jgi:NAD+ kinase
MVEPEILLQNIVIATHPQISDGTALAKKIASSLASDGIQVQFGSIYDDSVRAAIHDRSADLLIALGGDGTMLRAGHLCAPNKVPILGINLGKFGPLLLKNEFWLEPRMMLRTEHFRSNEKLGSWLVLNEVVVSRGQIVRPVNLTASVDGRHLTTYVADGLIAATPTGSTAYALAVGGPILPPELRNILLVPVAPHLSIDRALVLAEGSSVTITVQTQHQAVISVDGHDPIHLNNKDIVKVRASNHTVEFVRIQDPGYFYRNLTPHMNRNPSLGTPS